MSEFEKMGYRALTGAFTGSIYGAVFKADIKTAAVAFAISNVVWHLLGVIVEKSTGGWQAKPEATCASVITGILVLGTIQIVAFRHLNLIASRGTVYFSSVYALASVCCLANAYICTLNAPAAP